MMLFSFFLLINKNNVYALDKIEGGDVTIDSLGTIIKSLATKIQVFGIVLSFISLVVFVIQFIIGDDEAKTKKKENNSLYTWWSCIINFSSIYYQFCY